jgi:hypothetical protein
MHVTLLGLRKKIAKINTGMTELVLDADIYKKYWHDCDVLSGRYYSRITLNICFIVRS